jgi:hypothetical protein
MISPERFRAIDRTLHLSPVARRIGKPWTTKARLDRGRLAEEAMVVPSAQPLPEE